MKGGRGAGEEEGRGSGQGLGLHQCPSCLMDLGTTSTLFLHLQTGGGRCLQAMGLTIEAFRKEFRKKQSNTITKQKVRHGWGKPGCVYVHFGSNWSIDKKSS